MLLDGGFQRAGEVGGDGRRPQRGGGEGGGGGGRLRLGRGGRTGGGCGEMRQAAEERSEGKSVTPLC